MGKKNKTKKASREGDPPPSSPSSTAVSKRQRNSEDGASKRAASSASGGDNDEGDVEDLVFEDPFGDEFDPEDVDALGRADAGGVDDDMAVGAGIAAVSGSGSGGMEVVAEEEPLQQQQVQTKVWRAGVDELTEGEELEYDSTAYHMYHSLRPEWPCLSFDVMRDSLGTNRSRFPHTVFAVAGTQADRADSNRLQVMKLSDLHRTRKPAGDRSDDEEDSEEEGPDETDDDPTLDHINVPHRGGVNRVCSMPQQPHVVATWSETSDVHVWDLEQQVLALAKGAPRTSKVDPVFTFGGHAEASAEKGRG